MKTWIKLYTEMLDDPDVGSLSWAHRGMFMALLALAGKLDSRDENDMETGRLDTVDRLAWHLRCSVEELADAVEAFKERGFVDERDSVLYLTHYPARQSHSPSEDRNAVAARVKQYRARRANARNETVTPLHADCSEPVTQPEKKRVEEMRPEGAPPIPPGPRRVINHSTVPLADDLGLLYTAYQKALGGGRLSGQELLLAAEALVEVGGLAEAEAVLGTAAMGASSVGDRGLEAAVAIAGLVLSYTTHPEASGVAAVEEVRRLLPVPERLGDHATLARAWRLLTLIHFYEARYEEAEHAARRMIEHAQRAGDEVMARRVLPTLSQCAVYGRTPVPAAIERCERILAEVEGDRKATAVTLAGLARLEAKEERNPEPRRLL